VSNGNEGHSRRQVLTTVGSLSIAGAMGQAIASSSLVSPAPAAQPNSEIAEKTFEATADNVVNTLEAAYGVNRGKRRNHTKGFGALGIFVGASEAAEYSRSQLFSGQEIEVVARFSLAGGDPEASDTEKSPRGLGLQFRLPGGSLHHITMIHTPMFFAMMPKTFLDKFLGLRPDPATGKPNPEKFKAFLNSHPDNTSQFHFLQTTN
jgi:catalase